MPYTEDFKRIRNKFKNLYTDKAKAETFAFKEAFNMKIPTFQKRTCKFKVQKKFL